MSPRGKDIPGLNQYSRKTQDKHRIDTIKTQDTRVPKYKGLIDTKEDKGKRINMAFIPENYSYIQEFCKSHGITAVSFINELINNIDQDSIDKYIESLPFHRGKYSYRKKGEKMDRINLKFTSSNHDKIVSGAEKHNTTISQYVNMIIEEHKLNTI